jgi:hypothetical protein
LLIIYYFFIHILLWAAENAGEGVLQFERSDGGLAFDRAARGVPLSHTPTYRQLRRPRAEQGLCAPRPLNHCRIAYRGVGGVAQRPRIEVILEALSSEIRLQSEECINIPEETFGEGDG